MDDTLDIELEFHERNSYILFVKLLLEQRWKFISPTAHPEGLNVHELYLLTENTPENEKR